MRLSAPALRRYVPILDWGRRYDGQAASADLMAAVIVTIMLIPQSLAYALLAGLPPEMGLYASILPLVAYAVFGTSRALAVGPVAVVMKVSGEDEAIELANDTDYGLAAAVWTGTERGVAMAARLETGQVAVNGIVKTDPRLPSGGVKRSGIGRELGPHGIHEFVNAQQVWVA